MANLFSGHISTNGEYVKISEETGLTFTADTKYTIQVSNTVFIREGTVGTGFTVGPDIFTYTATDADLYIKGDTHINIAE